jgi:methylase of polypeptide subunit release factors
MDGLPEIQLDKPVGAAQPGALGRSLIQARADRALLALGQYLRQAGYRFTTVTPLTHRRVLARAKSASVSLTDIFGWSRPFHPSALPETFLRLLKDADALTVSGNLLRSLVRFSTLGGQLFVHSAFPTDESDAVFFGPDTYRFARILDQSILAGSARPPGRVLDIGAGSGAGGLHIASLLGPDASVVLSDINRRALRFCRINAALNGVAAEVVESDLFDSLPGRFDLVISNPPYLVDPLSRLYRHGGGSFGEGLSLQIVMQGIERLTPGGRLLLYTGAAIVDGVDRLHAALQSSLRDRAVRLTYDEIDPDVFGEELEHAPYDRCDRIAVVAVKVESLVSNRGYA